MRKNKARRQDGFTLIELLTIIGIIGVLSGLSLNSFSVYRASAAYAVVQTAIGVKEVRVKVTFVPQWEPSDEVKGLLGML